MRKMILVFTVLSMGSSAAVASLLMKNMSESQRLKMADVHKVVSCMVADRSPHCQLELMKQKRSASMTKGR